MKPAFASMLEDGKYPYALEAQHPRIFSKLGDLWGTPMIDAYLDDLVIDKRGGRQGFPADVMADIFHLYSLHERFLAQTRAQKADVWSNEEIRRGLEAELIEYSPRGFFRALELGNQRAISLFLQAGVDVELRNEVGWTPLMVSAFMGSEASATVLLTAGASVHAHDNLGYGPMHWAAYQGYVTVIALLVRNGANVNVGSKKGLTPLLQAAARGHVDVVNALLRNGAVAGQADKEGWTPLHKAVANGHLETVKALMAAGADPRAGHASGATPISIANEKKNLLIFAAVSK